MKCYIHEQKEAVAACVHCGKFICEDCKTEINGKNYCKNCVSEVFVENQKKLEKAEATAQQTPQTPYVFMNAAGGASSSSSSSASSASWGSGKSPKYPVQSVFTHILLFLFTAGIGNILYFLYIKNKQKQWVMQTSVI